MRIYITGATGFVGSHVMREAVKRGHTVTAAVRPSSSFEPPFDSVTPVKIDLRTPTGLAESLAGIDTVIHLAAAKAGDFYTQFAGTVVATENLLAAMDEAGVSGLVGISTFSVYDYLGTKPGTLMDEQAAIDDTPELRDEYARTKLIQEDLYRRFAVSDGNRVVILRPGMIYGPDNLWHALLGAEFGPRFLRIGSKATLPLTYVENCAEAIVLAAERLGGKDRPARSGEAGNEDQPAGCSLHGEVINIVDDHLPTQRDYAELVSSKMETPPTIAVPWPAIRTVAAALDKGNGVLFDGRAKFPGIAVPDRLHARFKPLRYSNAKAKRLLDWTPRYSLEAAIDRSISVQNGLDPEA